LKSFTTLAKWRKRYGHRHAPPRPYRPNP